MTEFKKSTCDQYNKKYESLINKKKDLSKTKHIRTEGESQKDEIQGSGIYPTSKYVSGSKVQNQLGDTPTHMNSRMFNSADKVEKKKTISLHDSQDV